MQRHSRQHGHYLVLSIIPPVSYAEALTADSASTVLLVGALGRAGTRARGRAAAAVLARSEAVGDWNVGCAAPADATGHGAGAVW